MPISFVEFYEKYFKIKTPDGYRSPRPLTDEERKVYNKAVELNVAPYLLMKGRGATTIIINPVVADALTVDKIK